MTTINNPAAFVLFRTDSPILTVGDVPCVGRTLAPRAMA